MRELTASIVFFTSDWLAQSSRLEANFGFKVPPMETVGNRSLLGGS